MNRVSLKGFDIDEFLKRKQLPNIALAVCGGFFRGNLIGSGTIKAVDEREPESIAAKTGGILQMTSYMSGVSGIS